MADELREWWIEIEQHVSWDATSILDLRSSILIARWRVTSGRINSVQTIRIVYPTGPSGPIFNTTSRHSIEPLPVLPAQAPHQGQRLANRET
jgi:hypothetical protein